MMIYRTRKAIERLYTGVCDVYEHQNIVNPTTKRTTQTEIKVLENKPCRVSYGTTTATNNSDKVPTIAQEIKLFIAPELTIKAGSKIKVTQNNVVRWYQASGEPAVHSNHQEITLDLVQTKA